MNKINMIAEPVIEGDFHHQVDATWLMNTSPRDTNSQRRDQRTEMGRFGATKLTMEDSMARFSGQGPKSGASRLAFAIGLALALPSVLPMQHASAQVAQVQIGTSFDCARAGAGQSVPSLVCQTPALQLADLHQMQAYYTLRHAQPERQQELRNQFTARIQGLVRECSTEQVRASGSQPACVEQALRDLRNFWVQQIQQTGNAVAVEEARQPGGHFVGAQIALRTGGFLPPDATVDGVYGSGTRQALARFQSERGMPANGFLTSATADALRSLSTAGVASAPSAAQQQRTATLQQSAQMSGSQENSRAVEGTLERLRQQQRNPESVQGVSRPGNTESSPVEDLRGLEQLQRRHAEERAQLRLYRSREKSVLEQVMNYTIFGNVEGQSFPVFFWISGYNGTHKCILTMMTVRDDDEFSELISNLRREQGAILRVAQERRDVVDIREFNQTAFRIREVRTRHEHYFMLGDEQRQLRGTVSAMIDRLQRAWGLAFQECPGRRGAF